MMLFISHRPIDVRPDPWVLPVGVGGLAPEGGISDRATGLHTLNDRLCEWSGILTAASLMRSGGLVTDSPWIGTCHYRRFLWLTPVRHRTVLTKIWRKTLNPMAGCRALIDPAHVATILEEFDCIMPRSIYYDLPLAPQYRSAHRPEDWEVFIDVLRDVFGIDAGRFFEQTHKLTPYSMFVMRPDRFLAYCDDAVQVIEGLLARLAPAPDAYQNRAIGFLMERYVTFSLHHQRLRAFETPVVLVDPEAQ